MRARGIAIVAVLLATLGSAPAGAAPDGAEGSGQSTVSGGQLSVGWKSTKITLITGDTITYSRDGSGRASVVAEPRSEQAAATYSATKEERGYYLIPDEVQSLIAAGVLDRELFNLDYLADNGYADAQSARLPLIVQYRQPAGAGVLAQRAKSLPAHASSTALAAVNGAAVALDKRRAGEFWAGVFARPAEKGVPRGRPALPRAPDQLGQGLSRVWLDAKVKAVDESSNTQIGAPVAWASGFDGTGINVGIIDTGIDATHPDLAGKVVAARNFTSDDPANVTDGHGHGTHVASIVAGDGDASGGRHKGVAPGGKLIIAKALDDSGSGTWSQAIEAMQWQAETQHARVVSMSFGGGPTDGTDPASQAVNNLSAQYGTLFVVAAGNAGSPQSVGAPGAATAALTVGAVDGADKLASFSSRGPRLVDFAIKPEITAPGVEIVAARASGTSMGTPVDAYYTAASGTSMATPHVSGAAAILVQQHPDWTGDQIKNALVGTAKDGGYTAYEQGAGRLDVARASSQHVFHDTASISTVRDTVARRVTYRNIGSEPVTLALSATLTKSDGTPAASAMAALSAESITVPAGGTAFVDVTITPTADAPGSYTGRLLAVSPTGDQLSVPIAARNGGPWRPVKVRINAPDIPGGGVCECFFFPVHGLLMNDNDPKFLGEPRMFFSDRWQVVGDRVFETTLFLPEGGVYDLHTWFFWRDSWQQDADGHMPWYLLNRPQVSVEGDNTVVEFNLREMAPITVKTPRPSQSARYNIARARSSAAGEIYYSMMLGGSALEDTLHLTPAESPSIGSIQYNFYDTRVTPQVTAALNGSQRLELHPFYLSEWGWVPKFTSDQQRQVVSESDLRSGQDVRGKVLMTDQYSFWNGGWEVQERLADLFRVAIQRGVAGILTDSFFANSGMVDSWPDVNKIPLLRINKTEAAQVRAALAETARPWLDLRVDLSAPYEYKLAYNLRDRVPSTLVFSPTAKELTEIQTTYHAQYPRRQAPWGLRADMTEDHATFNPGWYLNYTMTHNFIGQRSRVEYYNVTGPDTLWNRFYMFNMGSATNDVRDAWSYRTFTAATSEREEWNEALLPTQLTSGSDLPEWAKDAVIYVCDGCRQGDTLRLRSLASRGVSQHSDAGDSSHVVSGPKREEETHLFLGETEIQPQHDAVGISYYTLPAEPGRYRATSVFRDGTTAYSGTTVATTWTFQSARPTADTAAKPYVCIDKVVFGDKDPCAWMPLIHLRYHLGLAPDDSAPAGSPHTFTISAQKGAAATAIAGLRVWISPDGGKTWTEAQTTPASGDSFHVYLMNPTLAASPTDTVMVKAEAWDADGNSVQQVITDAYRLVEPPHKAVPTGAIMPQ